MKSVSSKVYNKKYFTTVCAGSSEFNQTNGQNIIQKWKDLLGLVPLEGLTVLDIGCGRGDITMQIAKKAEYSIGIDYSKDAIEIAKSIQRKFPSTFRNKSAFYVMNSKKLKFKNNSFDVIVSFDVFEHLYPEELDKTMQEIKRVLKKDGILLVHTGPNKILYDYTYPFYIFPINKILTKIDQLMKHTSYPVSPRDMRTADEKIQHVNEPTYFSLKQLFKKHKFSGNIYMPIAFKRDIKGLRSIMYNFLVALYPLSNVFPLRTLFCGEFICKMQNLK